MALVTVEELLRNTRKTYHEADKKMAEGIAKSRFKVSCKRGCGACCYQYVSIVFIEALLIGEFIVRLWSKEEVDQTLEALDEHTRLMHHDTDRYFFDRRPCPFFVPGEGQWAGECGIYNVRPMVCRTQFVVSDPVLCAPERPYDCTLIDSEQVTMWAMVRITGRDPTLATQGPLSMMVAEAIRCVREDRMPSVFVLSEARRYVAQVIKSDREAMAKTGMMDKIVR
jgi:Fe-S-cluster containining protein